MVSSAQSPGGCGNGSGTRRTVGFKVIDGGLKDRPSTSPPPVRDFLEIPGQLEETLKHLAVQQLKDFKVNSLNSNEWDGDLKKCLQGGIFEGLTVNVFFYRPEVRNKQENVSNANIYACEYQYYANFLALINISNPIQKWVHEYKAGLHRQNDMDKLMSGGFRFKPVRFAECKDKLPKDSDFSEEVKLIYQDCKWNTLAQHSILVCPVINKETSLGTLFSVGPAGYKFGDRLGQIMYFAELLGEKFVGLT